MIKTTKSTCPCPQKQAPSRAQKDYSVFGGIIIALLPKCPYCILAYSSAMTMCGGAKLSTQGPSWASYLLLGLTALTLLFILLNYKGRRTIAAALLVLVGSALILLSEFFTFDAQHYYLGSALMLIGIWVNGSFAFFLRKGKQLWQRFTALSDAEAINAESTMKGTY